MLVSLSLDNRTPKKSPADTGTNDTANQGLLFDRTLSSPLSSTDTQIHFIEIPASYSLLLTAYKLLARDATLTADMRQPKKKPDQETLSRLLRIKRRTRSFRKLEQTL